MDGKFKREKYREATTTEQVNESKDDNLFEILKEDDAEDNIFKNLEVIDNEGDKEGYWGKRSVYC